MFETESWPSNGPRGVAPISAVTHPLESGEERSQARLNRGARGGWGLALPLRLIQAGPLLVLVLIWVLFGFLSPHFLTQSNLTNILIQSSPVALLALGALVVVMVGSLDLSLGATVGFCTIVAAVLHRDHPELGSTIIPAVLLTGVAIGAVNSLIVVTMRFGSAFIVTLGTLYMVQSLSYVTSGGSQVHGVPDILLSVANGRLLGVPGPILLVVAAASLQWFFLNRVVWGRWIVAIGGSSDSASKVGIPVSKVMFSVYAIAALFASVAGLLVAGRNDAGIVDSGTSILLAIAAVVIGGTSLAGGRGSVWSTVIGAVILGSITNGLTLISVSPNWTPFAVGSVLVIAVGLDALRNVVERRLRIRQAQIQSGADK